MNKKGALFSVWVEILLLVVLIIGAIALLSGDLNDTYGGNYDLTGNVLSNSTEESLSNLRSSMGSDLDSGTSSQSSLGLLQLTTLPKILWGVTNILWDFVNGTTITNLVALLNLGAVGSLVATTLKLILWFSLAFVLLKVITRMVV